MEEHHRKHICDKHKKCCRGPRGPRGHPGCPGKDGATGPIGPCCPNTFDYVRAISDVTTTSRHSRTIDFYNSEGDLASSLDNTTGIFTSPVDALYLVTLNVTFQNFIEGAITVDSGNRSIKVNRFQYLKPEPAFIGQNVSVVNPVDQTGDFYTLFNTKLSASGVFPIPAGDQVNVVVYQDNPNERTITAFSELSIIKLENLPKMAFLAGLPSGIYPKGI